MAICGPSLRGPQMSHEGLSYHQEGLQITTKPENTNIITIIINIIFRTTLKILDKII